MKIGQLCLLCVILSIAGCGGNPNSSVSGTIVWNGEPVAEGRITFAPVDGQTAQAEAVITDGKYSVEVPKGEKIVQIYAFEVVGVRDIKDKGKVVSQIRDLKQILPENLNMNSELRFTVKKGKETYDFAK